MRSRLTSGGIALLIVLAAVPTGASAASPNRQVRLTVVATGDLLIHSQIYRRARTAGGGYRFDPMFRYVRPYVRRADLALCHLETPLTSGRPSGYPRFATPYQLAAAIRGTGWDACSTASNHTLDRGRRGVAATLRFLDRAGVAHAGSARSRSEGRRITTLRSKGVKVAFLAYTQVTNGQPQRRRWSLNRAHARGILADARRARRAGARVVIVNVHWGDEFDDQPNARQLDLASRLTRSSAVTAVVGQHAHVVQQVRWMSGKPVVFGEGNLISNQTAACCAAASQDGMIARLRIAVGPHDARVTSARWIATWVRHPDFAVIPVLRGTREGWASGRLLRASYMRTRRVADGGSSYGR